MKTFRLLLSCALALCPAATQASPIISELVAVGNDTYPDTDGNTPDWLEIHNPDATPVNLGGYHLTDDASALTKWTFPATTLPPGGYLVVFASDKDRATAGAELHTNFKLSSSGEYLALVAPEGSTVVDSFDPNFPAQTPAYSYGTSTGAIAGFFSTPTPGSANGSVLAAPLLAPTVTPAGATFTTTVDVTLATAVPDGIIRYTTDGSEPVAGSDEYSDTLTFSGTTHLRVAVFDPVGGQRGAIGGEHFIKLGTTTAAADGGTLGAPSTFTSDLPIMVIENFGAGGIPGPGSTLQTARLSLHEIDPTSGRSSLAAAPDASLRMALRKRGQSSSGFSKPQYRVELRDELDEDRDYPLLGLPADSDWVFNGPWTDKALIRNPLAFGLGRTLGIEAPRTAHFELFLSTDGGDLAAAEYVGVYVLSEKIKIGKDRVDIKSLDPTDTSEPDLTGGYLLRFEPPGIANDGPRATGWTSVEVLDPEAPNSEQLNYIGQYFDDFTATLGWSRGSGANNNGMINSDPLIGYPAFIDVDSFVHLHIIAELLRDQDAYVRSDYMFKDREGKLNKGPLWDYNLIAGTGCCFDNKNPVGWQYLNNYNRGGRDHSYETDWFVPLRRDPDFNQQFVDRWFELRRDGVLELDTLFDYIDELADPLAESALRNFTKWNTLGQNGPGFSSPQTQAWEEQVEFIKTWLTTRMAWIDSEFLAQPLLTPAGGQVAANADIDVGSDEAVYYTTDGSDPRLPGGGITPSALMLPPSLGDVPVSYFDRYAAWNYLDDGSDLGNSEVVTDHPGYGTGNWKHPDFDDSSWQSGSGVLGFGGLTDASVTTQINKFHPAGGQVRTYYFRRSFEVPEAAKVLSFGCEVLRDDGVIIYVNGVEVARSNMPEGNIGSSDLASSSVSGAANEGGYFPFDLDSTELVDGTNVIAVELHQGSSGSSDLGFDLALGGTVPAGDVSIPVTETTTVTSRARSDSGEWSAPITSYYVVGTPARSTSVGVTELNYHPANPSPAEEAADPTYNDDDFEFIELKNIGAVPIDLGGASFTAGISFTFPAPTLLAPGDYVLIVENAAAFEERYGAGLPVAGTYSNKMSNDGDTLRLVDLDGGDIIHFTFNDIWYPSTDGLGHTLVAASEGGLPSDYDLQSSWQASASLAGSPGRADGGTTYATWLSSEFTPAEIADPAITGPEVDLNGNGFGTFLSYALGLSPQLRDSSKHPLPGISDQGDEQFLSLTFRRRTDASDLTYTVQVSGSLANWIETTGTIGSASDNGDGTETVSFRDTTPISAGGRRFIRVKIEGAE